MKTLTDDRFAPITSSIGFIEAPLSLVAAATSEWWSKGQAASFKTTSVVEQFPSVLHRLEPLDMDVPRKLLVSFGRSWTAYFDCSTLGSDTFGPVTYLSRFLDVRGLRITTSPNTITKSGTGQWGSVQFELLDSAAPDPNFRILRQISATNDGGRWVFTAMGEPQPFEELENYQSRRIRDRFTAEMLERYCQAIGVDVFNETEYGPHAVLFERPAHEIPGQKLMLLSDVQRELGIGPFDVD